MAISINGSTNVISGVAVGGLPDGIVDADMLASNAVTAGKLASGVGGKNKQYKYVQSSTELTTTSSSYQDLSSTFSVAITPTSASNLLLCRFAVQTNVYETSASDANALIALTDDGASSYLMEAEIRGYDYGGNGMYLNHPLCFEHVKVAGNTNARTYSIRFRVVGGDQITINAHSTRNSVLSVMEIEP